MKKSLLFLTSCLMMLGVGAGVASSFVSKAEEPVKVNATDIDELGRLMQCVHSGPTFYAATENEPSWQSSITVEKKAYNAAAEGYEIGYILLNGVDVYATNTTLSYITAKENNQHKVFWIGKNSPVIGNTVCQVGDIIEVGGLWHIDSTYYFNIERSVFVFNGNSFFAIEQVGQLTPNVNTAASALYATPEIRPNIYAASGTNYPALILDNMLEPKGYIKVDGKLVKESIEYYNSTGADFLVCRSDLVSASNESVEIGGVFFFNLNDKQSSQMYKELFFVTPSRFVMKEGNWVADVAYNEASKFCYSSMKMFDKAYSGEGKGYCVSKGTYAKAKTAYLAMSQNAKTEFASNEQFASAYARYLVWAANNNDPTPFEASALSTRNFLTNNSSVNFGLIAIISVVGVASIATVGLFLKKRKHH